MSYFVTSVNGKIRHDLVSNLILYYVFVELMDVSISIRLNGSPPRCSELLFPSWRALA